MQTIQQKSTFQSQMCTTTLLPQPKKHSNHPSASQQVYSPRSKLSTATFIKWLRARFNSSLPKRFPYLYFPHELTRQTSIEQIFVQFDSDGSGGLSRDQVYDMFRGFGISITMQHLNQLYDSVQVNLQELDCQMFKRCALSQKSNKVFREIVRQLQSTCFTQQEKQYLPHNFTNMIIYLVYLSKRQQLKQSIQQSNTPIQQKIQNLQSLLKLKDLSLNNQRLSLFTENMKKQLKNKFRDIWQRVNEKHGQKFPLTQKMEEQFYQFLNKKKNSHQNTQNVINISQYNTKTYLTSKKNLDKELKSYVSKKKL